jgi:hypothetical protein
MQRHTTKPPPIVAKTALVPPLTTRLHEGSNMFIASVFFLEPEVLWKEKILTRACLN